MGSCAVLPATALLFGPLRAFKTLLCKRVRKPPEASCNNQGASGSFVHPIRCATSIADRFCGNEAALAPNGDCKRIAGPKAGERERERGCRRPSRFRERSSGSGGSIVRPVQALIFVIFERIWRVATWQFWREFRFRVANLLHFLLTGAPGPPQYAFKLGSLRRKHFFGDAHFQQNRGCAARCRGRVGNAL